MSERRRLVERVMRRDGYVCRAVELVPEVTCGGEADVHEIIPRSAWPGGWLIESNAILVCRRHHEWIGDHPNLAHDLGLHGYSWERP